MVSRVLRQVHLYLALVLAPWVLMYGLSTGVMNHRVQLREWYGGPLPAPVFEREVALEMAPAAGASAKEVGGQVLAALGMEGAYNASVRKADGAIVINRLDPIVPRRVTVAPGSGKAVIEKIPWDSRAYLERMHRRRGYQHDYWLEDVWAFSVDVFIAAVLLWAVSGLWMWWEMKKARGWGWAVLALGFGLFAVFVVTI
jgi:hypothetical protein